MMQNTSKFFVKDTGYGLTLQCIKRADSFVSLVLYFTISNMEMKVKIKVSTKDLAKIKIYASIEDNKKKNFIGIIFRTVSITVV